MRWELVVCVGEGDDEGQRFASALRLSASPQFHSFSFASSLLTAHPLTSTSVFVMERDTLNSILEKYPVEKLDVRRYVE